MPDLTHLFLSASYLGLFLTVFAESGLLLGFFLPGDTLLIAAGYMAQEGDIHLGGVMAAVAAGAVLGYMMGYWIGNRYGQQVFLRPGGRLLKPGHLERTRAFYERRGEVTVVLARFVPVVRVVAPTMAGVSGMNLARYNLYNVLGGVLWATSVPALGYWLGHLVPNLDHYVLLAVLLAAVFSAVPLLIAFFRQRRTAGDGK